MSDETEDAPSPDGLAKHTKWILPALMALIVIPFVVLALRPSSSESEPAEITLADAAQSHEKDVFKTPNGMLVKQAMERAKADASAIVEGELAVEQCQETGQNCTAADAFLQGELGAKHTAGEFTDEEMREITRNIWEFTASPQERNMEMNQRHIVETLELNCKQLGYSCAEADLFRRQYNERYGF